MITKLRKELFDMERVEGISGFCFNGIKEWVPI